MEEQQEQQEALISLQAVMWGSCEEVMEVMEVQQQFLPVQSFFPLHSPL